MRKPKIEHPKVFISYAWGDNEYQQRIVDFAQALMADGIDVVLDKWSLKEGNDTNAFMEKTVQDPSITNVLIMLDPLYAEKANKRAGGVGTETQIISQKYTIISSKVNSYQLFLKEMLKEILRNQPIWIRGCISI